MAADSIEDEGATLLARLRGFEGRVSSEAVPGDDPVNVPMVRHWVEAMGDTNPVHLDEGAARATGRSGVVAPATMLQVWIMKGLKTSFGRQSDAQSELFAVLDEAGFTSVVATNTEQEYHRELVPGDHLSASSFIESVSEEKTTGLGVGHFVTSRTEFRDQHDELVGTMMFRILKFRPSARPEPDGAATDDDRPLRPRPSVNRDNQFWFDGASEHRLLIQRCASCGELRHPPGPMCPRCRSLDWDSVEAKGSGRIYSYVVNHHPQVPAFEYPLPVALIELDEGTRLVADLVGVEPDDVEIGTAVQVEFVEHDDELTLPAFRPVTEGAG